MGKPRYCIVSQSWLINAIGDVYEEAFFCIARGHRLPSVRFRRAIGLAEPSSSSVGDSNRPHGHASPPLGPRSVLAFQPASSFPRAHPHGFVCQSLSYRNRRKHHRPSFRPTPNSFQLCPDLPQMVIPQSRSLSPTLHRLYQVKSTACCSLHLPRSQSTSSNVDPLRDHAADGRRGDAVTL